MAPSDRSVDPPTGPRGAPAPATGTAATHPPPTRRHDLVEVHHGIEVSDPYRWLEDDTDETAAWVDDQNRHTRALLDGLPGRAEIRGRLLPLLQAAVTAAPQVAGDRVFTLDRGGDREQAVLCVRPAAEPGPARVLVDPSMLAEDPTAALDWYHASPDGRLVAFGLSTGGDEQSTLHLLDVDAGELLDDRIPHARAASVAWLPDGTGFAYARYPDPDTVPEEERGYGRHIRWHTVGDDPAGDPVLYAADDDPTAWPDVSISRDGRWLLVHVARGWSRVDVHLLERIGGARRVVIEGVDAINGFDVVGGRLMGHTTLDAPRGRVVVAPLDDPGVDRWETLVPESSAVIEGFAATSASLLVAATEHAVATLTRHDLETGETQGTGGTPVALPEAGSLAGLSGADDRDEAFVAFTSFTRPAQLFRWRPGRLEPWSDAGGDLDPDAFSVERVEYPSTDGTAISLFLIRGRDHHRSPDTMAVLTGYGGFGITMGPAYSPAIVEMCRGGGLYAVAGIRGGAEEGESWHLAGTRERKQQVFDDFIAAADWLVAEGHTSRERLAIRGGSNGGLLVGAALTQRPDLCRAVHCAVPLLDMVRYHRFLIARLWIPEYGDPDVAEDLAWLHAYSPYHRVVEGTCYPAVLLTSGEGDSRVHPAHARKMAARLQAATSCGDTHPVLLQIEARAGHGQGKPVGMQADELADVLAFLTWQLTPTP